MMNCKAWEIEDFIGEKVFVRDGTDDSPLKIGTLVRYEEHHSGSALPIVEIEGEEYLCFSSILPYSKELEYILKSMEPQEQLDFMVKLKHFVLGDARKCRGK